MNWPLSHVNEPNLTGALSASPQAAMAGVDQNDKHKSIKPNKEKGLEKRLDDE